MATRWGIASAGKISHDFVTALSILPMDEHVVLAIAARDKDRAQEFASLHHIPEAYGSYEELARNPNIEIVYIGAIHPQHYPIAKLMLNNGKSVLCEKPMTMNYKQTKELVELAAKKKLFLMEAVWSRCFPAYDALRRKLQRGTLGEVKQIIVSMGAPISHVDRLRLKELGGGTILDLGVYCLQLMVLVFGTEFPEHISAVGSTNEQGVDSNVSCAVSYKGGKSAIFCTHFEVMLPNEAFVIGTNGTIKISGPFWAPTHITLPNKESSYDLAGASKPFNFTNSAGLHYEANEVRQCLKQGLIESPKMTHKESLLLAQLMDNLKKQIGVKYQGDDE